MEKVKIYRTIANLNRIDMFYFDTKADAPTILCIHGRWGRAETWSDFINHYELLIYYKNMSQLA